MRLCGACSVLCFESRGLLRECGVELRLFFDASSGGGGGGWAATTGRPGTVSRFPCFGVSGFAFGPSVAPFASGTLACWQSELRRKCLLSS